MQNQVHVTDLLQAAKLLADAQQDFMLSYLICMAILEAKRAEEASKESAEKAA